MKILWFLCLLISFSYSVVSFAVTPSYTVFLKPYILELKESLDINLEFFRLRGLHSTQGRMFLLRFGHVLFRYTSHVSDQNKKDLNSLLLELARTNSNTFNKTGEIFQKISLIAKEVEQRYQFSLGLKNPKMSENEIDVALLITKQAFGHTDYDYLIKQNMGIDLIQAREKGLSPLLERYFLVTFKSTFSHSKHLSEEGKQIFQNMLEDLIQIKGIPSEVTLTQADAILKKGLPIADKISEKFITPTLKKRTETALSKKVFKFDLKPYRREGLSKMLEWKLFLKFEHMFFKYSDYFSDQNKKDLHSVLSKLTHTDSTNLNQIDENFQKISLIVNEAEQRYQHLKETKNSDLSEKKAASINKETKFYSKTWLRFANEKQYGDRFKSSS